MDPLTQQSMLALALRQHGVVAHWQLLDAGLDADAIKHCLVVRWLHPVFRGVYAVGRPELSQRGRWMAATLACDGDSALSHGSAAALWGLRGESAGLIHVSAPGAEHRHPGIKLHRRSPMPPVQVVDSIPVTTPEWTLVDLAAHLPLDRLTQTANEADKLGIVDHDQFVLLVESLKRRRGIKKLRLILGLEKTDSNLERVFLKLLDQAGLPRPLTQQHIQGFRVDFLWPDRRMIVETDGLTYHRTPAEQAADRKRDQVLKLAGYEVVRFTNAQVRHEPHDVTHTMRALLKKS